MLPCAEVMIEAARKALQDFVMPVVDDQWAASALRSVNVILARLAARTPAEGPMLHEDVGDLATTLSEATRGLPPDANTLAQSIARFGENAAALLSGCPPIAALAALNDTGRQLIDDCLLLCHARRDEAGVEEAHAALRAYLMRHVERESFFFFFPVFVGRPV
jgi:hypothetical protein